jgi:hypothetical protein
VNHEDKINFGYMMGGVGVGTVVTALPLFSTAESSVAGILAVVAGFYLVYTGVKERPIAEGDI